MGFAELPCRVLGGRAVIMGPVRGLKKRKRAEKNAAARVTAAAPGSGDWWDDFSRRITGSSLSSILFLFALVRYLFFHLVGSATSSGQVCVVIVRLQSMGILYFGLLDWVSRVLSVMHMGID